MNNYIKEIILVLIISSSSIFAQNQHEQITSSNYDNDYSYVNSSNLKAVLILVFIPIYVANDIYFHPNLSFLEFNEHNLNYKPISSFDTGLRVDFDDSALEYGISHIVYESNIFDSQYNEIDYWGLHMSYLQNIFSNKFPSRFKVYVGPSINYVSKLGIGGVTGMNYRIFNRLKLDFRYELTSETNQLSAGLIFTFNKD